MNPTTSQPRCFVRDAAGHPLADRIERFLAAQPETALEPSGLTAEDYVRVIEGEIAVFRRCQDEQGRIIDPVEGREVQYATPCYAVAAAFLVGRGHEELLESAAFALDAAIEAMRTYEVPDRHGEWFMFPVMRAFELLEAHVDGDRLRRWEKSIAGIQVGKLYRQHLGHRFRNPLLGRAFLTTLKDVHNWNVSALSGECLRARRGLSKGFEFTERHLAYHRRHFTALGMYRDPNNPLTYDHLPRHFLATIFHLGYQGAYEEDYLDLLWRGAWTSLFMQSPAGEAPIGHRSAQHIWNEAQATVTYEIYASRYAEAGQLAEAGAFKRAARLSLASIMRWLRPDGSGYVVKNRYPIEDRHGYERYSSHSHYNLLTCSMLANACLFADDSIPELACPADSGGFAVPILDDFHKVFANAGGAYVEYDTCGDHVYNPTGLLRVHIRGGNPQLGPSDGRVGAGGSDANICVGPAWRGADGSYHSLADYDSPPSRFEVLEQSPERVSFELSYEGDFDGPIRITETVTLEDGSVTVVDRLDGNVQGLRVVYPMLVFDGLKETQVWFEDSGLKLALRDGQSRFVVLESGGASMQRTGQRLSHRNGQVEAAYAEVADNQVTYRIDIPPD